MKTAIYNGKLITPAEVLENKVLVLENDRIIDILAEDVIDLGQYDEKIDAHGRYAVSYTHLTLPTILLV